MNQATPAIGTEDDEQFLARFVLALEVDSGATEVVASFCALRPDLSQEIHALANLERRLGEDSATDRPPAMPERLGEFRLLRLIAAGGMGEIYEAEQESLALRRVAIKVIRRGQASPSSRARFQREQAALSKLHQTHVIPVFTAGEQDGIQYFAMPFIRGATLSRLLDAFCQEDGARDTSTPTLGELASHLSTHKPHETAAPCTAANGKQSAIAGQLPCDSPSRALGQRQVRLSKPFLLSAAEVMAQAAEAVEHAHRAGFIHRDLKPSNIMVDAQGHCWIIDFGLAGPGAQASNGEPNGAADIDNRTRTAIGMLGTIPYLAPEQLDGHADARSDVYGLGATLYELCTWRPPFVPVDGDTIHRIREEPVRPPGELAAGLPGDLNAICLKALARLPERRYQSANDFAADLRRWLNHEPTVARPARAPRRLWLWSRRNPGWAAAIGTTVLAFALVLVAMTGLYQAAERERMREADNNRLLEVGEFSRLGQGLVKKTPDRQSWFDSVWEQIRSAPKSVDKVKLRTLAAGNLAGLDARLQRTFSTPSSAVAFEDNGRRMLFGGADGENALPARLWDGSVDEPIASKLTGAGPVGFSPEGVPGQLAVRDGNRVIVWDVARNKQLQELSLPEAGFTISCLELSADGAWIGACGHSADQERGVIAIWNRKAGKLVLKLERRASAIAFAPDGTLLAAGDDSGRIAAWSLPDGAAVVDGLTADRAQITALGIGRDPRTIGQPPKRQWLLAAGDESATVVVWDLTRRVPRSICRGSEYSIHSIAFSPNGMVLASGGRDTVKLWDTTTGEPVLSIGNTNWITDVAFAPDGASLAMSTLHAFGWPGEVTLWRLESGRGIQTLRGLAQQVETAVISPDDQCVAALSHDGRIAVWNRRSETLLHVFEAPKVAFVDNASLAFSPDSKRLAFAGSDEKRGHARLWDLASGQEVGAWELAPGLNCALAFPRQDAPLLFQVEVKQGGQLPHGGLHPREYPRVGRLYDLRIGQPAAKRDVEITRCPWNIEMPLLPIDGRLVAIQGWLGPERSSGRQVQVIDTTSGRELLSLPVETQDLHESTPAMALDRSGRFLSIERRGVFELPSGKMLGPCPGGATAATRWSREMPFFIDQRNGGLPLFPQGRVEFVLQLDPQQRSSGNRREFSRDGRLLVWGNRDGTVNVCDIAEVRRRLTEIGLGW